PWERASARDQGAATDATHLLAPEGDDCSQSGLTYRLDAGDHAERAVELASLRHRVEMRSRPDRPWSRDCLCDCPLDMAAQVAVRMDFDSEPVGFHPACNELVCLVLLAAPVRPVRAAATSDPIQLLEPVGDASLSRNLGHGSPHASRLSRPRVSPTRPPTAR